jgi:uncharacterized membrane protein
MSAPRHAARAASASGSGSGSDEGPPRVDVRTWIGIAIAAIGALTVIGLVVMWPRGDAPEIGPLPQDYVDGTIVATTTDSTCTDIELDQPIDCVAHDVELTSGPDAGSDVRFSVRATQTEVPDLATGDHIVLRYFPQSPPEFRYAFSDFQRSAPMIWLLVAFVVVVVAFGRLQGLRALAGLGLSLAVLVTFVVPALLRDSSPVMVALAGSAAVAFLAIYLAHGIGITSTIALAGTLVSLAVTSVLAIVVASATQLSGLASQEAQTLRVTAEALDLRGLLLAGIVIGALGVLDDVTVSQVSTVAALRRANPLLGARALYAEANRVGRDHVASAVNTLVLAYAGASLPLLLFFAQGHQPVGRLITGELVAVEIVRMLVGSIGLVNSVPATTLLAALVLSRTDDIPADDGHNHGHAHAPIPATAAPAHAAARAHDHPERAGWPPPAPADRPTEPWF